ncbi:MAG: PIN domain-containing protein [Candidatus Methanospirareceae archaeon]
MLGEEERVVFDAYMFKGILGVEPYDKVYSKMLRKDHALVVSAEMMEKYSKAIANNNYSPARALTIIQIELSKLEAMQKLRWADKRIERMKEDDVKVKVEDEDNKPFVKAAFAMKEVYIYIVTQDKKHLLSKKSEFRKYQIEVLTPEEYMQIC